MKKRPINESLRMVKTDLVVTWRCHKSLRPFYAGFSIPIDGRGCAGSSKAGWSLTPIGKSTWEHGRRLVRLSVGTDTGMRGLVLKGATANMRGEAEGGTYHRWCTWLQSASWSMDNSHSMVLSSSSHIYFIYMEYFIPHIQRQDDVLSECRGTFSGYKFQLPISVGETVWG